jgi:hypothetical protein
LTLRVFLAGEGRNELGSRFGSAPYQSDDQPGVLHALLTKVEPSGWEVGGARVWKSIRKLRVGGGGHADTHNVIGAALDAKEAKCQAFAFSRDRDNDHGRQAAVEEGIRRVEAEGGLTVVGAVAVPTLEGWLLALLGRRRTAELSPTRAAEDLAKEGVTPKDGSAMVDVVERAALNNLPEDASSLRIWLDRARVALCHDKPERP